MVKRIASGSLLILLFIAIDVQALEYGKTLMKDQNTAVNVSDMEALLSEGHAQAQIQTLESRPMVDKLIEQVYITKKVAEEAKEGEIGSDPFVQAKLQRVVERFYFLEKLHQIDNKPLPDFSLAIEEEFAVNQKKYVIPEKIDVSHVLVRTRERYTEVRTAEEAQNIVQEVRQKALDGIPFEDLVKEYSEDPTKHKNKGSLGMLERGKLVKSFEQVAFNLKNEGDISDIVQTEFGFHVIKLNRRVPERQRPFESVKKEIEAKMIKEYRETERQAYFKEIIKQNKPKIYDDQVDEYVHAKKASLAGEDKK